jgi:hypothetical protein
MTAEVGIAFSGVRQTFTTRNAHVPGREVAMKLLNGPFSTLDGQWRFVPLGDGTQRACRVELTCITALTTPRWQRWSGRCFRPSRSIAAHPQPGADLALQSSGPEEQVYHDRGRFTAP